MKSRKLVHRARLGSSTGLPFPLCIRPVIIATRARGWTEVVEGTPVTCMLCLAASSSLPGREIVMTRDRRFKEQ